MIAWASRFRGGQVSVVGHAHEAVLEVVGLTLGIGASMLRFDLAFSAGPEIAMLAIEGELTVDGRPVRHLVLEPGSATEDGVQRPCDVRIDRLLEVLVDRLGDVEVAAEALPDGELLVRFGTGLEVSIPASATLAVRGASVGPPNALRMSAPLVVSVDGAHVRIGVRHLRWLGALARIRVHRATLHPDGSVQLEGGARSGIDGAVRSGLTQVSARLSTLVRSSPRFARVRAFLHS